MTRRRRIALSILSTIAVFLAAFAIYHLLFGRLFPWSPIKPGYKNIGYAKATLMLPSAMPIPEELAGVDAIMEDVEGFHELAFRKRVRIIIPRSHSEHTRLSGARAGACAYQTGTAIFLSLGHMRRAGRDPESILKHELSHAILFQNTSLWRALRIPEWFREGLAIYYGNPQDNFIGEEFTTMAVDSGYLFDILDHEVDLERIPSEHRYGFLHSEFRCFMEYLVERFGEDLMKAYMKEVIAAPALEDTAFREIMGTSLSQVAEDFYREVRARRWPPASPRERPSAR